MKNIYLHSKRFLGLSLHPNSTETLATQVNFKLVVECVVLVISQKKKTLSMYVATLRINSYGNYLWFIDYQRGNKVLFSFKLNR